MRIPTTESQITAFWSHCVRSSDPNGCWLWDWHIDSHGYGYSWHGASHRVALALFAGITIPKGQPVCHHCDVKRCIRPDHLYLGNDRSNFEDRGGSFTSSPSTDIAFRQARRNTMPLVYLLPAIPDAPFVLPSR